MKPLILILVAVTTACIGQIAIARPSSNSGPDLEAQIATLQEQVNTLSYYFGMMAVALDGFKDDVATIEANSVLQVGDIPGPASFLAARPTTRRPARAST